MICEFPSNGKSDSMSQDPAPKTPNQSRLVIRNIGLLLSGDLDHPILDADTVVAEDGIIQFVGKEKDADKSGECLGHYFCGFL